MSGAEKIVHAVPPGAGGGAEMVVAIDNYGEVGRSPWRGTVATRDELPAGAAPGDTYGVVDESRRFRWDGSEWVDEGPYGNGGGGGTTAHNDLTGASRALPDQHPVGAVTGLRGELDANATAAATAQATATAAGSAAIAARAVADAALAVSAAGYFYIDPANGNDATGRPQVAIGTPPAPFRTFAGAYAYALGVFTDAADLYFRFTANASTTEAVAILRAPPGSYGQLYVQGYEATAKARLAAASATAITLGRINRAVIVRYFDLSSGGGNGINATGCPLVTIADNRFGACTDNAVYAGYSQVQLGSGNVFYGAGPRGLRAGNGGTIINTAAITFEAGASFSDAFMRADPAGFIRIGANPAGPVPVGKRWAIEGRIEFAGYNIGGLGTLPGSRVGYADIVGTNIPDRRIVTANTTIHVNAATGDDDIAYHLGGTTAYPFKTIQAACDYARMLNVNGSSATHVYILISVAEGSYGPLVLRAQPFFSYRSGVSDNAANYGIRIVGSGAGTIIDAGSVTPVQCLGGIWSIADLAVESTYNFFTASGPSTLLALRGTINAAGTAPYLAMANLGACIDFGGTIDSTATFTSNIFHAQLDGRFIGSTPVFDFNNTAMSPPAVFAVRSGGKVGFRSTTADLFKNAGNITGKRYALEGIADLDTGGRASSIPGTTAGTDATGGLGRVW